ncbi:MAG: hypothetical protein HC809_16735 [Gammaproteobacteria bacterium]|nr:hypothetical protein [Gammaproteobacteria bacterium]
MTKVMPNAARNVGIVDSPYQYAIPMGASDHQAEEHQEDAGDAQDDLDVHGDVTGSSGGHQKNDRLT